MATLYIAGKLEPGTIVKPINGTDFQLEELYKLLNVEVIEVVTLHKGMIIICDKEGTLKDEPNLNIPVTRLYQQHYGSDVAIFGNAIICESREFK
jgi:hypothetical protein